VAALQQRAATATVAGEMQKEFINHQANTQVLTEEAVPADPTTIGMIDPALQSTVKMVCP
jgi:hypothetical protein